MQASSFANMIAELTIKKYQEASADGHNWCQVATFYMPGANPDPSLIYWQDVPVSTLIIDHNSLSIAYNIVKEKQPDLEIGCVFHKRDRYFCVTAIWVADDLSIDGVPDYYLFMGKPFPCGPGAREFTGTPEQWEQMRNFKVKRAMTVTCPHCGRQNYHNGPDGHRACDALSYACPGYIWCA